MSVTAMLFSFISRTASFAASVVSDVISPVMNNLASTFGLRLRYRSRVRPLFSAFAVLASAGMSK